jgi:hypothetical protein
MHLHQLVVTRRAYGVEVVRDRNQVVHLRSTPLFPDRGQHLVLHVLQRSLQLP